MEKEREYLHSWYVFLVTFFSLLYLLLNQNVISNSLLVIFVLFLFLKNGLTWIRLLKVLSYAFFFSSSLFLLAVINPSESLKSGGEINFGRIILYRDSLDRALFTMSKLFLVSFVSISSASAIDYTKVILHLIVHKGLRLFWGYPFLLALNSIALLKEEFERIRLNARLRQLPLKDKIFLFFPLLVFAIRHSQRGALSLVTRGLSDKKTFYFSYDLSLTDRKRFILFWIVYLALVVTTQIKLR